MTSIDPNPSKPLVYSSDSIHARRRRILKETRAIIAEGGLENFSVRKLCERADIAQRTLYNAFHSKERVIALAIREGFDAVRNLARYKTDPLALTGILDRVISVNKRNLAVRNYTTAVVTIYFSPTTPPDIWRTLQDMGMTSIRAWLNRVNGIGMLEDWVVIDELCNDFANLQYATVNDWCRERISDEAYLRRLVESILFLAVGATKGEERESARVLLTRMTETGELPQFPKTRWVAKATN